MASGKSLAFQTFISDWCNSAIDVYSPVYTLFCTDGSSDLRVIERNIVGYLLRFGEDNAVWRSDNFGGGRHKTDKKLYGTKKDRRMRLRL